MNRTKLRKALLHFSTMVVFDLTEPLNRNRPNTDRVDSLMPYIPPSADEIACKPSLPDWLSKEGTKMELSGALGHALQIDQLNALHFGAEFFIPSMSTKRLVLIFGDQNAWTFNEHYFSQGSLQLRDFIY